MGVYFDDPKTVNLGTFSKSRAETAGDLNICLLNRKIVVWPPERCIFL